MTEDQKVDTQERVSTAYLAHPIDFADTAKGAEAVARVLAMRDLIETIRRRLGATGLSHYAPGLGWSAGARGMSKAALEAVAGVNRKALDSCDCLVAVLPASIPTIGTVLEIERAVVAGKPTLLFAEHELVDKSASVQDWLVYDNVWMVPVKRFGRLREGEIELWLDASLNEGIDWLAKQERVAVAGENWNTVAVDEEVVPFKLMDISEDGAGTGAFGRPPTKTYSDDAGFDLYVAGDWVIAPGEFLDVPSGVALALPDGYWGLITGRSSTWRKRGLLVVDGVIDCGWRGELLAAVMNPGPRPVRILDGERLAQLIILPAWRGKLAQVQELGAHERGTNGFGSSGT